MLLDENRANILVVDDRKENVDTLRRILQKTGYNIVTASSGRQAINCAKKEDFAIIIMDVQMPTMNGFEAVSRIKEINEEVPIIFVTAIHLSFEEEIYGYHLGAVDYISKPYIPEILLAKVQSLADLYIKKQQLKEKQEALEKLHLELVKSNKELQGFCRATSHDLAEPLRKIVTFSDIVMQRYGDLLPEKGKDYLQRVVEASSRTRDSLCSLWEYSAASETPTLKEVKLDAVVSQAMDNLKGFIDEHDVDVEIGELESLYIDKESFVCLFENLIINAVKYRRPDAKIRISIDSYSYLPADYIIKVSDNGCGIDKEHHEKVFEPFRQLHNKKKGGIGMGLTTCDRIVREHGGSISIKSESQKGSSFIIKLPKKQCMMCEFTG